MLIATNFHYIRDSFAAPFPSIFGVTPIEFRNQLSELGRAGEFVSAAQITAAIDGGKPLPERAIVVTFDDGLAEQFAMAWPILREMGIPAIFFVNTACIVEAKVESVHKVHLLRAQVAPENILAELKSFARQCGIDLDSIDTANASLQYKYDSPAIAELKYLLNFAISASQRAEFVDQALARTTDFDEAEVSRALYMSPRQARELDMHGALGSHGHRHLVLGRLPLPEIDFQVRRAMEIFAGWDCRNVVSFSYPYGSREACPIEAADTAQACGLRFAFTTERAANPDLDRPMFLARFACNDLPGGSNSTWQPESLFEQVPLAQWQR